MNKQDMERWLSPDGLMKLDLNENHEPYKEGSPRTVENDNGIMYSCLYYYLLHTKGCLDNGDKDRIVSTLRLLRDETPGLYHRNNGRNDSLNSIDNMRAISALSSLIDTPDNRFIVNYGENHNWTYNNTHKGWYFSAWRQPADRAFYKLGAGTKPTFFEDAWLKISMFINTLSGADKTSDFLMNYILFKGLDVLKQDIFYRKQRLAFQVSLYRNYNGIEGLIKRYLDLEKHPERKNHPLLFLSKGLFY